MDVDIASFEGPPYDYVPAGEGVAWARCVGKPWEYSLVFFWGLLIIQLPPPGGQNIVITGARKKYKLRNKRAKRAGWFNNGRRGSREVVSGWLPPPPEMGSE